MRLTKDILERDIEAVDAAINLLRVAFKQTQDTASAQTIVKLMDTKDHLNQMMIEVSGRLATSEPDDGCPVIDLHDCCTSSESVDK